MIHAITATWAIDKAKKKKTLSRRCPKCRGEQVVEKEKINYPVVCESCRHEISPELAATQEAKETSRPGED